VRPRSQLIAFPLYRIAAAGPALIAESLQQRPRLDLSHEALALGVPLRTGTDGCLNRNPKALLDPFGGIVGLITVRVSYDEHVDVARRSTCLAEISGRPRSEQENRVGLLDASELLSDHDGRAAGCQDDPAHLAVQRMGPTPAHTCLVGPILPVITSPACSALPTSLEAVGKLAPACAAAPPGRTARSAGPGRRTRKPGSSLAHPSAGWARVTAQGLL